MNGLLKTLLSLDLDFDSQITGLSLDSRAVQSGDLFFAYPGEKSDGRDYIRDAVAKGAAAIVYEGAFSISRDSIPMIAMPNVMHQMGEIASRFYQEPSRDLSVIAITGTNGKTSCAYLLAQALKQLGKKVGLISTIGYGLLNDLQPNPLTTPDALTLQRLFYDFREQQVDVVVMEASSHALDRGRLSGVAVNGGIFTNLSHDHLDYHRNMEDYAAAKHRLFEMPTLEWAVLNVDDSIGLRWAHELCDRLPTYGVTLQQKKMPIPCVQVMTSTMNAEGIHVTIKTPWDNGDWQSALLGDFNVMNLSTVIASLGAMQFSMQDILPVMAMLPCVPGRLQRVEAVNRPTVFVDFAHTPDALEKVLQTLRKICRGKLICVFGCGGDRDPYKRPLMAKAVEAFADGIVLTNDNPRTENPIAITNDVLKGFRDAASVVVEHDRKQAIAYAIAHAAENDIVLVAGKGHEPYQIVGSERLPFDDVLMVENIFSAK